MLLHLLKSMVPHQSAGSKVGTLNTLDFVLSSMRKIQGNCTCYFTYSSPWCPTSLPEAKLAPSTPSTLFSAPCARSKVTVHVTSLTQVHGAPPVCRKQSWHPQH